MLVVHGGAGTILNAKAGKKNNSGIVEKYPKFGTVGAVALDKQGNLAAAASTGGMTNKRHGRIGDSPVIGAGTYASNATCAISCTSWGRVLYSLGDGQNRKRYDGVWQNEP